MAKVSATPRWQRAVIALSGTVIAVSVVGALYWAQVVFIPLALAIFLAFVLSPLVRFLQSRGLGRMPAVIVVCLWTALLLTAATWLVFIQIGGLAAELPQYSANVKAKVKGIRDLVDRVERTVENVKGELNGVPPPAADDPAVVDPITGPPPVVVQSDGPGWHSYLVSYFGTAAEAAAILALALVLTFFILLKREDLRNRFLRLMGHGQVSATTKAVDDAAQRISKYLLKQFMVNVVYGVILAGGLYLLGVRYALLWGALAAVLRYVPYVGTWLTAIFPVAMGFAMSDEWWRPVAVFAYIATLELLSNNVVEPYVYGPSLGASEVALLVSAAFWTFLWGPVGLVLSAPLTVVLLVIGKHVRALDFLDVLLGDEPPLEPSIAYYQRLLARDQDEAEEVVLAFTKTNPPEQVYDDLLIPALTHAQRDWERDDLSDEGRTAVHQGTLEVLEDVGMVWAPPTPIVLGNGKARAAAPQKVRLLACPVRDEADRVVLEMLRQSLDPAKWDVQIGAADTLSGELVEHVSETETTPLICLSALPPGGLARTRYLIKRLMARDPNVKIIVGRWGLKSNLEANREQMREAGAAFMATTLLEARTQLNGWLPVAASDQKRALEEATA